MIHATISKPSGRRHARAYEAADEGIDWAAAGWAGLIAGAAFILVQTALISLFTGGPNTDAIRQIAAIALSESVLPPPTPFTVLVFLAAMAVHLPLSLLYTRVLASLIHDLEMAPAVAVGAVFGAALYAVNYYAFTGLLPWFAASRGAITLATHVVFGIVATSSYILLTERQAHSH